MTLNKRKCRGEEKPSKYLDKCMKYLCVNRVCNTKLCISMQLELNLDTPKWKVLIITAQKQRPCIILLKQDFVLEDREREGGGNSEKLPYRIC